jgi:hypothetical protein
LCQFVDGATGSPQQSNDLAACTCKKPSVQFFRAISYLLVGSSV